MKYWSTRGNAPVCDFETALLAGLAPDGGLYVPTQWPQFSPQDLSSLAGRPYSEVAARVLSKFAGDAFSEDLLRELAAKVYDRFDHNDTAPLVDLGDDQYILELFHGPTLAFKDFAMQILGALFDHALEKRGQRLTVLAATSGDTGAAAIEALAPCEHVEIVVLHPENRVTDVQRRMMTCVDKANVLNIAVQGSFDDCQAIVKDLFADQPFRQAQNLSGVNSINWGRLAAQTVYYFTALHALGGNRSASFSVPTGNFGDVFAGYAAKRMGAKINKLIVATNANDILHRAIASGDYSSRGVMKTTAPSMDIQIASNFERILFDAVNNDPERIRSMMAGFKADGQLQLSSDIIDFIKTDFLSCAVDDEMTLQEIARHFEKYGSLIDPHTSIGRVAAQRMISSGEVEGPMITLSTAHPAKFPDAVKTATGQTPALTPRHADLFERTEHMVVGPADTNRIKSMISEWSSAR